MTFLGTASSCPSKYRNVTALYYDFFGRGGLLIDCGEDCMGQMKRRWAACTHVMLRSCLHAGNDCCPAPRLHPAPECVRGTSEARLAEAKQKCGALAARLWCRAPRTRDLTRLASACRHGACVRWPCCGHACMHACRFGVEDAERRLLQLRAVCITHMHADHHGGLYRLLEWRAGRWDAGASVPYRTVP